MLFFIPQGRFLPGLVIVQKLISLKPCVPEDITQRCLGASAVHKKRPHVLLLEGEGYFLISYMQPW